MSNKIQELRYKLINHQVYQLITSKKALKIFMESHVVAVWDFMSLVKSLQFTICGNTLPWVPPINSSAARLINEIVLGEESDVVGSTYKSHFELYLDAMREIGCNVDSILSIINNVRAYKGNNRYDDSAIKAYINGSKLSPAAVEFASSTFATLRQPVAVQAAVFFYAREKIIPDMFREIVGNLEQNGVPCKILLDYLSRHIQLDSELHGPLAEKLLNELYNGSFDLQQRSESYAASAIEARIKLWDEIANRIKNISQ